MIDKLFVHHFRGLRDLEVEHLNRINIVVGPNNAGKTSLLESIRFLSLGFRVDQIARLARIRDGKGMFRSSFDAVGYILGLFPYMNPQNRIAVSGQDNDRRYLEAMQGEIEDNPVSLDARRMVQAAGRTFKARIKTEQGTKNIEINDRLFRQEALENFPSVFVASYDHLTSTVLGPFVNDNRLMEYGLKVARMFDSRIASLYFQKNIYERAIDYVGLGSGISLPLSFFGDGLRKMLMILGAVQKAHGGVLLVDEFDDTIHMNSYLPLLNLLEEACEAYQVQIVATTHRGDVINSLMREDGIPPAVSGTISFITMRNIDGVIRARTLALETVLERARDFGFEVRE